MLSEGGSFVKGMVMGGLFCAVVSVIGNFSAGPQPSPELHLHHHVKAPTKEELLKLSEAKRRELAQRVRVFCAILVQPRYLQQWVAAKETWSKHCDKAKFYSSESVKALESVDLAEKDDWMKMRKALKHAYEHGKEYSWFLLAEPSTFTVIENLKYLVLNKDPEQPFYLGRTVRSGELEYVEYNSGIVLSAEALRRLLGAFDDPSKCPEQGRAIWKVSEEKELAACLKYTGVFAENAEDAQGRELFHRKAVGALIEEALAQKSGETIGKLSDLAISFSSVPPNQMHVMMFGVYRLRPYGHTFHDSLIFLPPEGSDND
ncbi:C1GALT1-specific chaperone 1 [Lepisosteus oculatus]|uniref:C1GALT1-specific chaperone 1 n=1 Tax=Lepisosteus oculatus TaxID=7918 RepID=W5NLU2_LEPOC|nr:PREDICTED: C1GALT1-specific chaperone 1 [Lepisosteus oculatus]